MATYLDQDIFPELDQFTPNYAFIMRTLQLKQTQYDQGFAKVKSIYNSIMNADMLGEDHKQKRDQIIANAEKTLKNLSTVDLSLPQNVTAAKNVFQPFYDDDALMHDIQYTRTSKSNIQSGLALQHAEKKEDRDRYWGTGVQYIMDGMEEYKNATDDQRKGMSSRRYVAKPNIDDQVMTYMKDNQIKMSIDKISGQAKYTDVNGKEMKIPLMNLYMAFAENDPEAMEGFKVMGSVARSQFIRDNTAKFGSKENAAKQFDQGLVTSYKNNKQFQIDNINQSLLNISPQAQAWREKIQKGLVFPNTPEAAEAATILAQESKLKDNLKVSEQEMNTAQDRILNNPIGHLGNVYLTKNAHDLAQALSGFGSRKIDVNPLYEKFVFPKELELFKHELAKNMEHVKADETIRIEEAKAQIKNDYGDGTSGTTGGGSVGKKGLDVPIIEENKTSAVVPLKDKVGQADAYTAQQQRTAQIVNEISGEKLRFVETVLSSNEIKDQKGNLYNNKQRSDLLKNGKELDRLYNLALKKHDGYIAVNDPKMYNGLDLRESVRTKNDVWSASITFRRDKLNQITQFLGGENNKGMGWMYGSLLQDGLLPGASPTDKAAFSKRLEASPDFKNKVEEKYKQLEEEYNKFSYVKAGMFGPVYVAARQAENLISGKPTKEQAKTALLAEAMDNYDDLVENVKLRWNKEEYNYYGGNFDQKGGGVYNRSITYQGKNEVKGEKADVFAEDLFTKVLSNYVGDETTVKINKHTDESKGDIDNDDDVRKIFFDRIKGDIYTAIRSGKGSDLGGYSITFSGTANADNPDYNKYTIRFDQDYINKLVETKNKPGGNVSSTQAKALINGIDIFVKKSEDKSIMSQQSTIGEVDILLSDPKNNNMIEREVVPGYGVKIEKLATGGYRLGISYLQITKDNLKGTPQVNEMIIPEGQDVTNIYYDQIRNLRTLHNNTIKKVQEEEQRRKSDPNLRPLTLDQILQMSSGY